MDINRPQALLLTMLFARAVFGQHPCAVPGSGARGDAEAAFNAYVLDYRAQGLHLDQQVHCIPVVVHVINDPLFPLQRVVDQLDRTNEHLRRTHIDAIHTRPAFLPHAVDSHIELRLAASTPEGSTFTGMRHIQVPDYHFGMIPEIIAAHIFDHTRYLNVWVFPGLLSAWGVFPWEASAVNDGVVVPPEYMGYELGGDDPDAQGGKIFTHEVGHFLGLYHTFHGVPDLGNCDDGACDHTGDLCCDTPKDWRVFPIPGEDCSYETIFCEDGGTIVTNDENYMFYNPDRCLNMFSGDQRIRMRACLHGPRHTLTTAETHAATGISCLSVGGVDGVSPGGGQGLFVYPNPSDGMVQMRVPAGIHGTASLHVRDALGRVVLVRQVFVDRHGPGIPIDLRPCAPGPYILEFVCGIWRGSRRVQVW